MSLIVYIVSELFTFSRNLLNHYLNKLEYKLSDAGAFKQVSASLVNWFLKLISLYTTVLIFSSLLWTHTTPGNHEFKKNLHYLSASTKVFSFLIQRFLERFLKDFSLYITLYKFNSILSLWIILYKPESSLPEDASTQVSAIQFKWILRRKFWVTASIFIYNYVKIQPPSSHNLSPRNMIWSNSNLRWWCFHTSFWSNCFWELFWYIIPL